MGGFKKSISDLWNKLKADKKSLFTVILGLSGILLILLSELPSWSVDEQEDTESECGYTDNELCHDVEKLISQVRGAGEVNVMLTYENGGEKIYAKDSDEENSSESEKRTSNKHIIVDGAQGEDGLIIKELYPEVRGIAVVCSGGDDPQVRSEISSLLSALFDIGANKISIARRAEKE